MRSWKRRVCALGMAVMLLLALTPAEGGQAVLSGVYLTAANEKLMDLNDETMPFWSDGVFYISNALFDGTDLGVNYIRNRSQGLAVLYTPYVGLYFDLEEQTAYDRQGVTYSAHAIEKGEYVFFPVDTVCRCFGLIWTYTATDTVPLVRITSSSAQLDDAGFIDAAGTSLRSRYAAYERQLEEREEDVPSKPPVWRPVGQRIHLIIRSSGYETTMEALEDLREAGVQATFLLSAEQMEEADLLRALVAEGHSVALLIGETTESGAEAELERARDLLWQAACAWLDLAWYEGAGDLSTLLSEMGCAQVTARLDRSGTALGTAAQTQNLLDTIGRYRGTMSVYLGGDGTFDAGLSSLLEGLREGQYDVCAWRIGT